MTPMNQQVEQAIKSEPIDSGTDPIQIIGAPTDESLLVQAKARGSFEGHALPDALSNLAPAFRSHPAWILISKWTTQVIEDHQNTKKELDEVKRKLEIAQSDLFKMTIKNVELTSTLNSAKRASSYKARWQAMGSFFLGLSPAAYFNTVQIYGFLLGGIGLVFLYFAWREDAEK